MSNKNESTPVKIIKAPIKAEKVVRHSAPPIKAEKVPSTKQVKPTPQKIPPKK